MHPTLHVSYGILVPKYKNVMITLLKEQENPLKINFCFQAVDKIVLYVSTHGDWDCTTLEHYFSTDKYRDGTISMHT